MLCVIALIGQTILIKFVDVDRRENLQLIYGVILVGDDIELVEVILETAWNEINDVLLVVD